MKKYLILTILPVLALTLAVDTVSAHGSLLRPDFGGPGFGGLVNATPEEIAGWQNTMFQQKADLLGISVDEVKSAWAEGKSWQDLAEELGMSQEELRERIKTAKQAKLQAYLQILVDNNVITQAQADQRLELLQGHWANKDFNKFHRGLGWRRGLK